MIFFRLRRRQNRLFGCGGSESVAKFCFCPEPVLVGRIIRAPALLPVEIGKAPDGFWIQRRMFNAASHLVASVTTLGSSCVFTMSSLTAIHFRSSKRNRLMQQSTPPHQAPTGLAPVYFGATPVVTSNSPLASK